MQRSTHRRSALDRAITNLVDNACKFDQSGGPIEVVVDGGSLTRARSWAGYSRWRGGADLRSLPSRRGRAHDAGLRAGAVDRSRRGRSGQRNGCRFGSRRRRRRRSASRCRCHRTGPPATALARWPGERSGRDRRRLRPERPDGSSRAGASWPSGHRARSGGRRRVAAPVGRADPSRGDARHLFGDPSAGPRVAGVPCVWPTRGCCKRTVSTGCTRRCRWPIRSTAGAPRAAPLGGRHGRIARSRRCCVRAPDRGRMSTPASS